MRGFQTSLPAGGGAAGLPKYTPVTTDPSPPFGLPAHALPLVCHPATPCAQPLTLHVSMAMAGAVVGTEARDGLLLRYHLSGDVTALSVPAPAPAGAADGLWQHTCFEAFVAVPGEAAYREFNFSPSGQWAAYRFSEERQRDTAAEATPAPLAPTIDTTANAHSLNLLVWLPSEALPVPRAGQALQWGLSAVVEDRHGQRSYWALHHPAQQPDFHHRGGMALTLSWPPCNPLPVSPTTP